MGQLVYAILICLKINQRWCIKQAVNASQDLVIQASQTSVFATSNSIEKIIPPLQSRFFILRLEPYTYEQFFDITVRLLTLEQHSVDEEIAKVTADAVWNTSTARNIRDCVRVAKMAKSVEDVNWLVNAFLKNNGN
jgi:hypothetical protein